MSQPLLETRTIALKSCPDTWVTITMQAVRLPPHGYRVEVSTYHALEHAQGRAKVLGVFGKQGAAQEFLRSYVPLEPRPLNSHNPSYARACISATRKERAARKPKR